LLGTVQKDFGRVHKVFDGYGNMTFYTYTANKHYVYVIASNTWLDLGTDGTSAVPATVSYVNGVSYIFKPTSGVQKFTSGFAAFADQAITGITDTSMLGMIGAVNYGVAWTADTVYWSAPGTLANFEPIVADVATGAGSTRIKAVIGKIIMCVPISSGFIIYCSGNIVSARYSGNSVNPWIFKEVVGSAGIFRPDAVNYDNTADTHFVYTEEGFKSISIDKADQVFPELTEFLKGYSYFYSDNDGTYSTQNSTYVDVNGATKKAPLATKISYIANRYVCISYGAFAATNFEFILIYDRNLKQWGQIKVSHVDVFNFFDVKNYVAGNTIASLVGELGIGAIGVMKNGGSIATLKPVTVTPIADGVEDSVGELIIGDIRMVRAEHQKLTKIKFSGYFSGLTVKAMSTKRTGLAATEDTFSASTVDTSEYINITEGRSHRIRIRGTFNLSSIEVDLDRNGSAF
jgi:hypothetical protein